MLDTFPRGADASTIEESMSKEVPPRGFLLRRCHAVEWK